MSEFDFSEFHPLMHRVLSQECFRWHGGPLRHVWLWLNYQAPDPLGALLCRLSQHELDDYWTGEAVRGNSELTHENASGQSCIRCGWGEDE